MRGRFRVRVATRFEAAHHLTSYRGRPEPAHGHSWRVEAVVGAAELDGEGISVDFLEVRRNLDDLAARFDHRDINQVSPFDRVSPTTERIAAWFFKHLAARLPEAELVEVTVWEGSDFAATYRPSGSVGGTGDREGGGR